MQTPASLKSDHAAWVEAFASGLSDNDRALVAKALHLVDSCEGDCAEERERGLAIVTLLKPFSLDGVWFAAALLAPLLEAEKIGAPLLTDRLGTAVVKLMHYTARLSSLRDYHSLASDAAQADRLRKMLLAIAQDPRAVAICLADQLLMLRGAKSVGIEAQIELSEQTLALFAPLAGRLGIWQFKWEMEDLAFRYLHPETYKSLARSLDHKRIERERYIKSVIERLQLELVNAGISADVAGRPKHIYSIWNKMNKKQLGFHDLMDVLAVRVLVDNIQECYAVLSLVHHLWPPLLKEFDDYIAHPKPNLYQSLHTAVVGPEDRPLEVQIRTHAMHQHAEFGVAAHWLYKEANRAAWAKSFLEQVSTTGGNDLLERFKAQAFDSRIYVLTPQGRVVDLPTGATPLDFAYALHTDLGHRCRGAKVDGSIVPLVQCLQSGQQVEVLTTRQPGPSRDWLNPALKYVRTDSARTKIKRWFKQQDFERSVTQGRITVERELRRAGVHDVSPAELARRFNMDSQEALFAAVGRGNITSGQLEHQLRERVESPPADDSLPTVRPRAGVRPGQFHVAGVANLLTRLTGCCKPVPGDAIIGYITQGQGISIHRVSCRNVAQLRQSGGDRIVEVAWGAVAAQGYLSDIVIEAGDRKGLLRDLYDAVGSEQVNITAVNSVSNASKHRARVHLTVEIRDSSQLNRILQKLQRLPDVVSVRRKV